MVVSEFNTSLDVSVVLWGAEDIGNVVVLHDDKDVVVKVFSDWGGSHGSGSKGEDRGNRNHSNCSLLLVRYEIF